jgi:glycosyltransferase involved in cell wall biosynthesis
MKLALVLQGGVDRGAHERVIPAVLWLLERLAQRHTVQVFTLSQEPAPDTWPLLGAQVHNVGTDRGMLRRFLRAFGAEHRAAPFDVIHALFGWTGCYGAAAAWRYRVPMLFHAGGGEFVDAPDIGYGMQCTMRGRCAMQLTAAAAKRVTVPTPQMQRLAAARGVAATCVPLGVALDRWPARPPRARDVGRRVRLLHVADLRPVKDQAMLLRAAAELRRRGVDFDLHVAGCDTLGGAVQQSALAHELGDRVHWHGVVNRAALRAMMEDADLLLVTSRHEAGPIVALEAAVAGVPVVGTAVGHVDDWAPDAAVAVPVGDASALANLLNDDACRVAIAHAAQRRAQACDADATAEALESLYYEALSRR